MGIHRSNHLVVIVKPYSEKIVHIGVKAPDLAWLNSTWATEQPQSLIELCIGSFVVTFVAV